MTKVLQAYCGGCITRIALEDRDQCRINIHEGWDCIFCPVCHEVFNDGCPVHVRRPFSWAPAHERGENVNEKLFVA